MLRTFLIWACLFASMLESGCASLENALIYYPEPGETPYQPPPPPIQDVELRTADGTKIHARWVPHPKAKGAILFCHGNGGNIDLWGRAVKEIWQNLEESVLIFDYPGYGHSGGRPSEMGCCAAAEAAYDWLVNQQNIPADFIVLYGESLGGGVAVDLASRRRHRALVLVRTFDSLTQVAGEKLPLLPVSWIMTNRFDSAAKIASCQRPIFIAHGDQDRLIPIQHGRRLHQACAVPAQFYTLRGLGHNEPLPADFYVRLRYFLANLPAPKSLPVSFKPHEDT